jgi:hypothetical protein
MTPQEMIVYVFAAIAYFIPFYIAWYRKANGLQLVFWFNLLFAWTFVAWVLMIIVALSLRTSGHSNHSLTT